MYTSNNDERVSLHESECFVGYHIQICPLAKIYFSTNHMPSKNLFLFLSLTMAACHVFVLFAVCFALSASEAPHTINIG